MLKVGGRLLFWSVSARFVVVFESKIWMGWKRLAMGCDCEDDHMYVYTHAEMCVHIVPTSEG